MRNKRLKILSKSEINELYGIPQFNDEEKKAYFLLNDKEFQLMDSRGSLSSKVYFILQLGYFKGKHTIIPPFNNNSEYAM